MVNLLHKIRRGLTMPPHLVYRRLQRELRTKLDKKLTPQRAAKMSLTTLLKLTKSYNLASLWQTLSNRPFPANLNPIYENFLQEFCPNTMPTIYKKAEAILAHRINLLGSGEIHLGDDINWHKDYKTNHVWPLGFFNELKYVNFDDASDVKIPWEISRMQWLIPLGQAYRLNADERYAEKIKYFILDWIKKNPYAHSINWTCTMEVALRIIVWTWFFHVFKTSNAWQDENFRRVFLANLFLHAEFTARHLEESDINGNHYTANAAGLVFAGLFFGDCRHAKRWQKLGWKILTHEIHLQFYADGVNHEMSVPYHRLVTELFLWPALYAKACQLNLPKDYQTNLIRMAEFIAAYTKPSGLVPLWGDADDARVLPFGMQNLNDHRYLIGMIATQWQIESLKKHFSGSYDEIFWCMGQPAVLDLVKNQHNRAAKNSQAFHEGGFYIITHAQDHIFIDCGPIGLRGRGGHGHNDCLSFEADLLGVPLISDCGAYVYTADYRERNLFRSTAYHNTPQIAGQEINRFISWDHLWSLHNDAKPMVHNWHQDHDETIFCGSHTGYLKLNPGITPKRTISLNHHDHILSIHDEFLGSGQHQIQTPLHFHPNVKLTPGDQNEFYLQANQQRFLLTWSGENWTCRLEAARISPSYGVVINSMKLIWENLQGRCSPLTVCIAPIYT